MCYDKNDLIINHLTVCIRSTFKVCCKYREQTEYFKKLIFYNVSILTTTFQQNKKLLVFAQNKFHYVVVLLVASFHYEDTRLEVGSWRKSNGEL